MQNQIEHNAKKSENMVLGFGATLILVLLLVGGVLGFNAALSLAGSVDQLAIWMICGFLVITTLVLAWFVLTLWFETIGSVVSGRIDKWKESRGEY